MYVLSKGNYEDFRYMKKCPKCKSVLVFSAEDVSLNEKMKLCIKCPTCEKLISRRLFSQKYDTMKYGELEVEKNRIGF